MRRAVGRGATEGEGLLVVLLGFVRINLHSCWSFVE
jgi:hypothetical protein